jgi:hypothetical protein
MVHTHRSTTHCLASVIKTQEENLGILVKQTCQFEKIPSVAAVSTHTARVHTKLRKDIPEPVDNEHIETEGEVAAVR